MYKKMTTRTPSAGTSKQLIKNKSLDKLILKCPSQALREMSAELQSAERLILLSLIYKIS